MLWPIAHMWFPGEVNSLFDYMCRVAKQIRDRIANHREQDDEEVDWSPVSVFAMSICVY